MNNNQVKCKKIHIFGGANGIGRWFVEKIFLTPVYDIYVYDIDQSALLRLPPEVKCIHINDRTNYKEIASGIHSSEWVILSIPVNSLSDIVNSFCPHVPAGCLIIDFSSVKEEPLKAIYNSTPKNVEILGIHPLFGPLISSPVGQIVAFTAIHRGIQTDIFQSLLQSAGLLVSEIDASEHDNAMATIQALTHFTYLSFAKTIVSGDQSLSELLKLRTPPFHFLTAFTGRILSGSPLTYINIQRTTAAKLARERFLETASALHKELSSEDIQEAVNSFESIRKPFSGGEISQCTSVSRLATNSIEKFEHYLHEIRERKVVVLFVNDNTTHIGRIEEVTTDKIIFSKPFKKIKTLLEVKYAIAFNESAIVNYRRRGIEFGAMETVEFKKHNIVFMNDDEQQIWMYENLLFLNRRYQFDMYGSFDPEILDKLIPQFVKKVHKASFISLEKIRGYSRKVTLDMDLYPDVEIFQVVNDVQNFIKMFSDSAETISK